MYCRELPKVSFTMHVTLFCDNICCFGANQNSCSGIVLVPCIQTERFRDFNSILQGHKCA
jgi:hypothetical protein